MNSQLLLLCGYLVTILALAAGFMIFRAKSSNNSKVEPPAQQQPNQQPNQQQPQRAQAQGQRAAAGQAARRVPVAAAAAVAANDSDSDSDGGDDDVGGDEHEGEEGAGQDDDEQIPIPDDIRAALAAGTRLSNEQKKIYDKIQKKNAKASVRRVRLRFHHVYIHHQ
jgi:hypothetical protein